MIVLASRPNAAMHAEPAVWHWAKLLCDVKYFGNIPLTIERLHASPHCPRVS